MARQRLRTLLATLALSIGQESAQRELRWMKQAVERCHNPDALPSMVSRRARGEPLQYILGTQSFGPLNLLTRPPVLIPRPETEHWSIQLSNRISPTRENPVSIMDLCTGSGCIPLLLCHLWPSGSTRAYGVDISAEAVQLAADNAKRVSSEFMPFLADIRDPSFITTVADKAPFDIVTSNPPYIPKTEYELLPSSVKDFEDHRALLGDPCGIEGDGLSFYRFIARLVSQQGMLASEGCVVLEVGDGQSNAVETIMRLEGGLRATEIWLDPWEKQRVVFGRK